MDEIITLDKYAILAARTAGTFNRYDEELSCAALGLAGEAGEFADLVKKHLYHDHPLDLEKLVLEVGDVLWYVAAVARALDVSLQEIAERNIDKLKKRYPDGFNPEQSINRSEGDHS